MDVAKRFAFVPQHRWPENVRCPVCGSGAVIRDGCDDMQPCRQGYRCKARPGRFDDLTATIKPVITAVVAPGALVHADEHSIYARLPAWDYRHKTVCHGRGEHARDKDGDGFCEVRLNTIEGFWSLLRSWLRPHRGISQDKLPLHLGFFQFMHNARRHGKTLLGALVAALVA